MERNGFLSFPGKVCFVLQGARAFSLETLRMQWTVWLLLLIIDDTAAKEASCNEAAEQGYISEAVERGCM